MASVGNGKDNESLTLNIMPMLDIFSILVCFLLMSYSTDPISHDVDPNLELPDSATIESLDEIPSLVVNRREILINDKKIVDIIDGDVPEADRAQGAIYPVYKELEKLAKVNLRVVARGGEEDKSKLGVISMEMDKGHHFKLLKRIMLSAQQAEFITFKLLVAKEDF